MIGGSRLTVGDAVAASSGNDTVVVVVRVIAVVVVVDVRATASAALSLSNLLLPSSLPLDSPSPCFELNSSASQHFTPSN